jgi:hypothetical protein
MKFVLFILAFLCLINAWVISANAASAVHQIAAYIFYLITAVLFVGAAIVDAIEKTNRVAVAPPQNLETEPTPKR